jgi:hypothetical protein
MKDEMLNLHQQLILKYDYLQEAVQLILNNKDKNPYIGLEKLSTHLKKQDLLSIAVIKEFEK